MTDGNYTVAWLVADEEDGAGWEDDDDQVPYGADAADDTNVADDGADTADSGDGAHVAHIADAARCKDNALVTNFDAGTCPISLNWPIRHPTYLASMAYGQRHLCNL